MMRFYGDILRRLCGNPGRYRALGAAKKIETNQGFDKDKSKTNSKGKYLKQNRNFIAILEKLLFECLKNNPCNA